MNETDESDESVESVEFTTSERRLWLLKFIIKHPIYSFKAFWSDLEDEDSE
jgi:hypothetical protein